MKNSFYKYSLADLNQLFINNNLPSSGVALLYNWHYKKRKKSVCTENLAKKTISYIEKNLNFDLPEINTVNESVDKTVKFLFKLECGKKVETVLIPFNKK
jgi:23S rRNA (adenine2503-C2)-methyltransferase